MEGENSNEAEVTNSSISNNFALVESRRKANFSARARSTASSCNTAASRANPPLPHPMVGL